MNSREYIKKIEEERKKAKSLAIQILNECEQQGTSEYAVYCLPKALENVISAHRAEKEINTHFRFGEN